MSKAADQAKRIVTNTFERQGAVDAGSVEIVNKETPVNVQKALSEGSLPFTDSGIIDTDRIISTAQLDDEAFMAQEIEIHLMEAANEDEPQFAEVTVNGMYRLLHRGESYHVRRSHVAVLAQAKEMRLQQKRIVNQDGSMGYEEKMVTRQTYPFSVISDPAGRRGAEWIKKQLSSAR